MDNVKIKKASIKDDLFLSVEFLEELAGHNKKDTKLTSTVPIHVDLKTVFEKLHLHLAILCDEEKTPKNSAAFTQADFPGYVVKGFTIGGNEENEGVTISGSKGGEYGIVNLSTPFTKFESELYPFLSELHRDIMNCVDEVKKYLFEGKRAPERQLDMFDNEEEVEFSEPKSEEAA